MLAGQRFNRFHLAFGLGYDDFAAELLKGERSGKYSPLEVAQWLEDLAEGAIRDVARAGVPKTAELRRLEHDVAMQAGLGRFFAARFRSGVLYAIHERTGDRRALEESLKAYQVARAASTQVAAPAKGVYAADLSASDKDSERGQWADRLPLMDDDIARMEQRLASAASTSDARVAAAILEVLSRPSRHPAACTHRPPSGFRPNEALEIGIRVEKGRTIASARLYYRRVNQAERCQSVEMELHDDAYQASIPGSYTDSPFPLAYYFEFKERPDKAWLYPGFAGNLANLPYFVVRHA